MKAVESSKGKPSAKSERERKVLFGLIEQYIKTGRAVGSQTLQESGFEELSSATIRNYFAHLEEEGYLEQQHTSGGRIPTQKAWRLFADEKLDQGILGVKAEEILSRYAQIETKEVVAQMQKLAEELSRLSSCAIFLSAPRFDQDTILDVKVVQIDTGRLLVVLITDFGSIHTETLFVDGTIHSFGAKRIESYFRSRLFNLEKPDNLEPEEEEAAKRFYNEVMVRYLVSYSHFLEEEVFKTGFSNLLNFQEFHDPAVLSRSLSLFENQHTLRLLLRDAISHDTLKVWIGEELAPLAHNTEDLAFVAMPYKIHNQVCGVIALLGPTRLSYPHIFGLIRQAADSLSQLLTKNIYKFKISVRQPGPSSLLLEAPEVKLLENKTEHE
ncbi:MAG: heat-inducible transcriptional repressor HrcA [Chlamydiia bacterium]|nr:heat-inducible transcriptional repressor HrcA [Chlamydiia bacterium]